MLVIVEIFAGIFEKTSRKNQKFVHIYSHAYFYQICQDYLKYQENVKLEDQFFDETHPFGKLINKNS